MISQEQAEEIAARYRAMGARDCTADTVLKFLGPTPEEQVSSLNEICLRFGVTREELDGKYEWDEGIAP